MIIVVKGLGLIGGSFALDLKHQLNVHVTGMDSSEDHLKKAMKLGLVHDTTDEISAISDADYVILAMPVDQIEEEIRSVLDATGDKTVVIDAGSTKTAICRAAENHPERHRFVAAHPLAGTEYSGPDAALKGLFAGKKNIICESEKCDSVVLESAQKLFESLGMKSVFMNPEEHDKHLAYVSHLSHVSSFMLGLTVLDIENDEKSIFELAGTGFASTVRLAKSHPVTWSSIFMKNRDNVLTALNSYIAHLENFKDCLQASDEQNLKSMIQSANRIQKILN